MPISTNDFWKLVIESGLLSPEDVRYLAETAAQEGHAADAEKLAKWLIAGRKISQYHAKILLAGRAGPFQYGEYQIYDRIESGRLAGIFRAVHMTTRHPVCLFFLSGQAIQDPQVMARLSQQAMAANRASSGYPHLLRCYHLCDQGAFKYVVIEDLQGRRVERELATKGALSVSESCRIARQLALGLSRMHGMGQVHGDVRPANVWIEPSNVVKLLMFPLARDPLAPPSKGLAKAKPSGDGGGKIPPEADYLAPELWDGAREPDVRSDIYALGATLYHMLANQAPFPGGDLKTKHARHVNETPKALNEINSQIPAALAKLVNYMLAKDPDMRYQQVTSVIEALLPHIAPADAQTKLTPPSKQSQAYEVWLQKSYPITAMPAAPAPAPTVAPAAVAAPAPAPSLSPAPAPVMAATAVAAKPVMAAAPAMASPMMPGSPAAPMMAAPVMAVPGRPAPVMGTPVVGTAVGAPMMGAPAMAAPAMAMPGRVGSPMAPAMAMPASPVAGRPFGATAVAEAPAPAPNLGLGPAIGASSVRVRRKKNSGFMMAVLFVLVLLAGAGGGWWYINRPAVAVVPSTDKNKADVKTTDGKDTKNEDGSKIAGSVPPKEKAPPPPEPKELIYALDDGIYASPTTGKPVDLKYLAPGIQGVIALRPADIMKHPEGAKILDARVLGDLATWFTQTLPALGGVPLEKMEQAIIGLSDGMGGPPKLSLVVRTQEAVPEADLVKAWGEPMADMGYFAKDARAWYLPKDGEGKIIVVAPQENIKDIMEGVPAEPPLDAFRLLRDSDDTRMFTFVIPPRFLLTSNKNLFTGTTVRLLDPLDWFLTGHEIVAAPAEGTPPPAEVEMPKAVLVSAHLTPDVSFAEVRIFNPEAGQQKLDVAQPYHDRIKQLKKRSRSYVFDLDITPYSKNILAGYFDMVAALTDFTRVGVVDKQIVIRSILPAKAAHNLVFGTYLCMVENPKGGGGVVIAQTKQPTGGGNTIAERLQKKTTLSFDRNTLEISMKLLADDLGFPITIRGGDLQLEGITKNQSFGLNEVDKPAIEIFMKIMKQANPDGKLVYIIKKGDSGAEEMFITTRAAVAKNKETLPPEFEVKK
jgi:serine/threonine protein kinase